jgi:phytoene dehydrogenase-like protein
MVMHYIVVGAGMAGLVAARTLQQHGHTVTICEASDAVGGRVRSDVVNGFVLDRGFQVLFDAYPAVKRWVHLGDLALCAFDPGAVISYQGQTSILTDPLRDWRSTWAALWSDAATTSDKLRVLWLSVWLRRTTIGQIRRGDDTTTHAYLRAAGFSERVITRFFAPFYGGIFLDRSLTTSAKCFLFDFKMLSDGRTVVPREGMGALSAQLAHGLDAQMSTLLLQTAVVALVYEGSRVVGVRTHDGRLWLADGVILAVPAPVAQQLAGVPLPSGALATTTLYWEGDSAVTTMRKIWLNANSDAFVNNACQLSAVAPQYAPAGRHLWSATVLGVPEMSDDELYAHAEADMARILVDPAAQQRFAGYRRLRLYRIPYAQFPQPPGIHPTLPKAVVATQPGLFLAGEYTHASSINAAMISGEHAAQAVMRHGSSGRV